MGENKSGKRIIAISVSPKAYDEILTLKGDRTWTKWLLELMLNENPINKVLNEELAVVDSLKFAKPKKAEKPQAIEVPTPISIQEIKPKPKKAKAKVEVKSEAEPEVEYGKVNQKTGGTPVDINKIGRHGAKRNALDIVTQEVEVIRGLTENELEEIKVGKEIGELVLER